MKAVSRNAIVDAIKSTNGQVFTVLFKKRTTGEVRRMNCRLGVKKYLKGGQNKLAAAQVITVFDMAKQAYRCIPIEGIIQVRCGHQTFEVSKIG